MAGWNDPRFIITLLLIGLFGYAYIQDASDEAMKGAIIAAFSTAYGFWLASKDKEQSTANTGKALDAIRAAQESTPLGTPDKPITAVLANDTTDPVPTTDVNGPQSAPDARSDDSQASPVPDSQIPGATTDEAPSAPPGDPTWR